MGAKPSVEETIFDMKLKSKELSRMAAKAEKQERVEKGKVKKAIEKGNVDGARIFSQNAIRQHNDALRFHTLASKMEAVAGRLDAAHRSQGMTNDICKAVPGLQKSLNALNTSKLSENMDAFEKIFEDIEVKGDYVSNAIDSTTASSIPTDQVEALMHQVAEEHALDVSHMLTSAPNSAIEAQRLTDQLPKVPQAEPLGALEERMNNLRK